MKITRKQLRRIIKEEKQKLLNEDRAWVPIKALLARGDTVSATNKVLDHFWMDDTWHQEEDALEDILGALPYTASTEEIKKASEGWLKDYRAGKYRPKTEEEMKADWARGNKPRQR